MSADTAVLTLKQYDELKVSERLLKEIISGERKPIGFIYSGHIECSKDIVYKTDSQLTQAALDANVAMALKMSQHVMMEDQILTITPVSNKIVAAAAFITGALVATFIFILI